MRWFPKVVMASALTAALVAPIAAQPQSSWQERFGRSPGAAGDWIEFEVVQVAKKDFTVTARDRESGDQMIFKVPPDSFIGQRFTADFSGAREGDKVAVRGLPESKLGKAQLETPPGAARPGGSAGVRPGGDRGPKDRRARAPRRPEGAAPDRGAVEYRVTAVDAKSMTLTAVSDSGGEVRLEVDPKAFDGYLFRVRVDEIRKGGSFSLLALNRTPLSGCCTLVSTSGR